MPMNNSEIQKRLVVIPCRLFLGERGEVDGLLIGNRVFFKVKGRWRNLKIEKNIFENETFLLNSDLI